MVTLNMESRNPMGRVYAENRSKTQKPLGFKGLTCEYPKCIEQVIGDGGKYVNFAHSTPQL